MAPKHDQLSPPNGPVATITHLAVKSIISNVLPCRKFSFTSGLTRQEEIGTRTETRSVPRTETETQTWRRAQGHLMDPKGNGRVLPAGSVALDSET